jgi:hypothetical protein
MDRFPEAFRRFENDVDVDSIRSFRQLRFAFSEWAGERWVDSGRQLHALSNEARRYGLLPTPLHYRVVNVTIRGHPYERWRDAKTGRFVKQRR